MSLDWRCTSCQALSAFTITRTKPLATSITHGIISIQGPPAVRPSFFIPLNHGSLPTEEPRHCAPIIVAVVVAVAASVFGPLSTQSRELTILCQSRRASSPRARRFLLPAAAGAKSSSAQTHRIATSSHQQPLHNTTTSTPIPHNAPPVSALLRFLAQSSPHPLPNRLRCALLLSTNLPTSKRSIHSLRNMSRPPKHAQLSYHEYYTYTTHDTRSRTKRQSLQIAPTIAQTLFIFAHYNRLQRRVPPRTAQDHKTRGPATKRHQQAEESRRRRCQS